MVDLIISRGTLPLELPFPTAFSRVGIREPDFEPGPIHPDSITTVGERMPPDLLTNKSRRSRSGTIDNRSLAHDLGLDITRTRDGGSDSSRPELQCSMPYCFILL
jgi:hypothetical protein